MKVTAFHFMGQVEQAAQSYLSQSMIFSSQNIEKERFVNFRRGVAGLQFYRNSQNDEDPMPMGSIVIETVQESSNKSAFKCYISCLPDEINKQFFLLIPADRESYTKPMEVFEQLSKLWEKNANDYLPDDFSMPEQAELGSGTSMHFGDSSSEGLDEYEGLTPEEIEAVTGVRPGAENNSEESSSAEDLSMQDIEALMSGESSQAEDSSSESSTKKSEEISELSIDDIEALMSGNTSLADIENSAKQSLIETKETPDLPENKPTPKKSDNDIPIEMSADDIFKQISGGAPVEENIEKNAPTETPPTKGNSAADNDEPVEMSADDIFKQITGDAATEEPAETPPAKDNNAADNDEPVEMSADDIFKQITGDAATEEPAETPPAKDNNAADNDEPVEMSADDIFKQITGDAATEEPAETPPAKGNNVADNDEPVEMSADDIWKQISGDTNASEDQGKE